MSGGRLDYGARAGSYATGGVGGLGYGRAGLATGGVAAGRPYGATAFRPYGFNAYGGYHNGWVHGYWNGHNYAGWGWRNPYWGGGWGLGLGLGLGWGLSSWGYGSSLYGMGYLPYDNPYYAEDYGGGAVAAPYNYSQPIDTSTPPADEAVTSPAMTLFDAGRASFQQGNYADALQQADAALAKLPGDTTLHEFRGLCLFALKRYDEAAAALYAVLSVGPGWDWATLVGLYPDVATYTAQLRALEEYCRAHKDSASARFVLVYHYLTQGHVEAAVSILKDVVALKPGDALSTKLLKQLDAPKEATAASRPPRRPRSTRRPPRGPRSPGPGRPSRSPRRRSS